MDATQGIEEAEARKRRIVCRRLAGEFFDRSEDLKWLYFGLALQNTFEEGRTEEHLEELVRQPIWDSLWGRRAELVSQAARYIGRPGFHCTALRDFFIAGLMQNLVDAVADDPMPRKVSKRLRIRIVLSALIASALLWVYASWWSAALVIVPLFLVGKRWEREYEGNSRNKYSLRSYKVNDTRNAILKVAERVKQGGFDEPTIVRQLQIYDINLPRPSPNMQHEGIPFVMMIDNAPISINMIVPIPIPDVLYELLRLPRRNIESEISRRFMELSKQRRAEISLQWRKFVDRLLTYDESQSRAAA